MAEEESVDDCANLLGIDYYAALDLTPSCTREDIRKAFRRAALRFHPERVAAENACEVCDPRQRAFAVVAEAYDVLSDPLRKAIYDQYGEARLKKDFRGPDGCVPAYVYHGEPLQTYREFFGTENPYADLLDNLVSPAPALKYCPDPPIKKKDEPVIKPLPLTLNEVFYGGIKKMKIQRIVLVGGNNKETTPSTALDEKILSISIMPGMPSGTKIVFPEEGDQGPTKIPADVVFVTEDKPHERFRRDGDNLRMTQKVHLSVALTGTIVTVYTIDDRILRVPITSVISPDYEKTLSGEGLPIVEDPERRGNLIIDFEVEFPVYLPPDSKKYVRMAFGVQEGMLEEDAIVEGTKRAHKILLDGKMYTRTDKLSQICSP